MKNSDKDIAHTAGETRQLPNPGGFIAHRVAHAGGGINNRAYTNSFEALDGNIKKGFRYFELDFLFTKDNRLVCLHDWEDSFKRTFGFATHESVTLREFNYLVENKSEFKNCTVNTLAGWMTKHPSAYIVTDVRGDNIEALGVILTTLPNAKARVIPQIYDPASLGAVKGMGFEKIIWTLYRFRGSNDEVLGWVEEFDTPIAVAMLASKAKSTLPKALKKRDIPSYVHTVNKAREAEEYINKFGVTEIYTDFLRP